MTPTIHETTPMWSGWRCRRLRARLVGLACNEISPGERRSVESHLTSCARCRAALAGLRDAAPLLRSGVEAPMLDEAFWRRQRHAVMSRIRSEPEPARAVRASRPWALAGLDSVRPLRAWVPALTVATAVLSLVLLRAPLPWQEGVPSAAAELDHLDAGDLLSVADMAGLSQLAGDPVVDAAQNTAGDAVLPDLSDDDLDALTQLVGERAR
jgi:hypothetical protein